MSSCRSAGPARFLARGASGGPEAMFAAILGVNSALEWQMLPAEQLAILTLLRNAQPACAIEIGTRFGGSLQVLSQYCERVYSLDIDPTCPVRLSAAFPNATFLTGSSHQTLPELLGRLQKESAALGFVLIDGDHSAEGVRQDINNLLRFQPTRPLYVVLHDSFNPDVRRGISGAAWAACPYVHLVELDLVPGILHSRPDIQGQMWGGLALAVLLPEKRPGALPLGASYERLFHAVLAASVHAGSPPAPAAA